MRWFLALAALVGCYDPRPNPGSPCSDTMPCPSALRCIDGFCGGPQANDPDGSPPPIDMVDGSPFIDSDGDGKMDADDNCRDVPNADQGNEDGDAFGDVCDPCPIDSNNTDGDSDGVGDACDPHPGMGGDQIVAFDGFHNGVPAGWQAIGMATAMGDDLQLTTVAGNHTAIVPPIASITNGTVTTFMTVDSEPADNSCGGPCDAASTVSMPYDPSADQGIFCELYTPVAGNTNNRGLSLWDSQPQVERGGKQFNWKSATGYKLVLTRQGNGYSCTAAENGQNPQTVNGQSGSNPAQLKPSIAIYGSNVHVAYMLVVKSP